MAIGGLRRLFEVRRAVRALERLGDLMERQNQILDRLADRFSPVADTPAREAVEQGSGVSFLDGGEIAEAEDAVERIRRFQHREPDDEEIVSYIQDERTKDLDRRLQERALEEQARLQERRGW